MYIGSLTVAMQIQGVLQVVLSLLMSARLSPTLYSHKVHRWSKPEWITQVV